MRYLLSICFVLGVVACGPPSPYQTSGFLGAVWPTQLNTDVYMINALGNGFSSAERMSDFASLRAAETCLDKGFAFFSPVAREAIMVSETTIHQGWLPVTTHKPTHDLVVQMFKDEQSAPSPAFSCQTVYDSLAPKYK